MRYISEVKKVFAHRKAFFTVRDNLGLSGFWFHDLDKILLSLLPEDVERKLHRRLNRHHVESWFGFSPIEAIIDWECARITKPDKPLDARGTMEKFYPEWRSVVEPILDELGL